MKNIYVTRPFLPPLEEVMPYLEDIWQERWLTNNGRYHQEFEKQLKEYLGVKYVSLFANGTLALMIALQALRITGEVITTPYSFVATTHALWWNNIKPVFVDIEPKYCNLNPKKIESAITPLTTAILPVHVYGNPCDVESIQKIADTYGLKVLYDACHAFGVTINGNSVLNFGDLSVLSFHATKVFNTFEGGAIVCHDEKMKKRIDYLKNFGFADEVTVVASGINAKMNEFQAALGLLQIKHFDKVLQKRKEIADYYQEHLKEVKGLRFLEGIPGVRHNYAYFPIFVDETEFGMTRDELYYKFREKNIYVRRYFYPLISQFPTYRGLPSAQRENLPVAEVITRQVLCLPIFPEMNIQEVDLIISILKGIISL